MSTEAPARPNTYGGLHEAPSTYLFGVSKKMFYVFASGIVAGIVALLAGFFVSGAVILGVVVLTWARSLHASAASQGTNSPLNSPGGASSVGAASTSCALVLSRTRPEAEPESRESALRSKCGGESTNWADDSE